MRRSKALGISAAGIGIAGATLAGLALAGTGVAAAFAVRAVRRRGSEDFAGRVVLITGGSRGLGLALAQEFGRRGAKLAICARREQELIDAEAKLRTDGVECFWQVCDVSKRDQVKAFVAAVRAHYGRIDVLVNNAGIIQAGPFENQLIEDFEQAMAINFWGAVYFTYEVIGEMLRAGRGNIVNICSVGGKVAVPHLLPYSASKFAITGFSEG